MKRKFSLGLTSLMMFFSMAGIVCGQTEETVSIKNLEATMVTDKASYEANMPADYVEEYPYDGFKESLEPTLPWVLMTLTKEGEGSYEVKIKNNATGKYVKFSEIPAGDGTVNEDDNTKVTVTASKWISFDMKKNLGITTYPEEGFTVECYVGGKKVADASTEQTGPAITKSALVSSKTSWTNAIKEDSVLFDYVTDYPTEVWPGKLEHNLPWMVLNFNNPDKKAFDVKIKNNETGEYIVIPGEDKSEFENLTYSKYMAISLKDLGAVMPQVGFTVELYAAGTADLFDEAVITSKEQFEEGHITQAGLIDSEEAFEEAIKEGGLLADYIVGEGAGESWPGLGENSNMPWIVLNYDGNEEGHVFDVRIRKAGSEGYYELENTATDKFTGLAFGKYQTISLKDQEIEMPTEGLVVELYATYTSVLLDTVKIGGTEEPEPARLKNVDAFMVTDSASYEMLPESYLEEYPYEDYKESLVPTLPWIAMTLENENKGVFAIQIKDNATGAYLTFDEEVGEVVEGGKQLAGLTLGSYLFLQMEAHLGVETLSAKGYTVEFIAGEDTLRANTAAEPQPVEVKAPTFSIASGTEVAKGTKIAIETETESAKILYTIVKDGKPDTEYTDSIVINEDVTISALAFIGEDSSAIVKATYTIKGEAPVTVADPEFSVPAGKVAKGTEVTIETETEGAKIYYTVDGSEPDDTKTEYKEAIVINETVTIKAIAIKGESSSKVVTVKYEVVVANGVQELAGVSIYPNPNNGDFNVNVPVRATVAVFAANGMLVKQQEVNAGTTMLQLQNSGVYFVRVAAEGQVAVKRVVVR